MSAEATALKVEMEIPERHKGALHTLRGAHMSAEAKLQMAKIEVEMADLKLKAAEAQRSAVLSEYRAVARDVLYEVNLSPDEYDVLADNNGIRIVASEPKE